MVDDSQRNPEADTFEYVRLIVEALNKMNRLDTAVNTIHERLPVELYRVVEKSNNEVALRHPSIIRAYAARKEGKRNVAAESDELRAGVLNDLLWTLYARFEAIAESHRVVYDVVVGIVKRDGIRDSSNNPLTRGFKELWKLFQNEVGFTSRFLACANSRRFVLYFTIISQPTAILAVEVDRASLPAEACTHAHHVTEISECLSSQTWILNRQSSRKSAIVSSLS